MRTYGTRFRSKAQPAISEISSTEPEIRPCIMRAPTAQISQPSSDFRTSGPQVRIQRTLQTSDSESVCPGSSVEKSPNGFSAYSSVAFDLAATQSQRNLLETPGKFKRDANIRIFGTRCDKVTLEDSDFVQSNDLSRSHAIRSSHGSTIRGGTVNRLSFENALANRENGIRKCNMPAPTTPSPMRPSNSPFKENVEGSSDFSALLCPALTKVTVRSLPVVLQSTEGSINSMKSQEGRRPISQHRDVPRAPI